MRAVFGSTLYELFFAILSKGRLEGR